MAPRRMTWQASLPLVSTMAEMPCLVTERKTCSLLAALIASTAIEIEPSVPFLNPIGIDNPDESFSVNLRFGGSRTDRSPGDEIRGILGEMVSKNSVPAGRPRLLTSRRNPLARRKPLLIWNEPLRLGSLIRPFQPTVVRVSRSRRA